MGCGVDALDHLVPQILGGLDGASYVHLEGLPDGRGSPLMWCTASSAHLCSHATRSDNARTTTGTSPAPSPVTAERSAQRREHRLSP